ncbi:uncharacterized protein LOC114716821 isoform X2 [Neltuma alba]|uniref:uncharacterized protein LOC114716821 isoform X2 n=1 Tax=Neltuma alba TaxID=207710 RepID=UPI0010A4213F|nr:uncharacterized protein LOC114716821 isoform X2 [Prosopis alba]
MPTALPLIPGAFSSVAAPSSFPPTPRHSKCHASLKPKTLPLSRRDAGLLLLLSLSPPSPAFAIGISGPKDWLKEQKKKSSKFLLAPVDASRESLRSAYLLLLESDADYTDQDFEKFQNLFRSAARDCVPQERNSFVSFQANTGVEVCTFRLIVKNAASLLGNKDPVKLKAEALLDDLIRSFTFVSGLAGETTYKLASNRKIADAVEGTLSSLDKFEQGIKDCLEI